MSVQFGLIRHRKTICLGYKIKGLAQTFRIRNTFVKYVCPVSLFKGLHLKCGFVESVIRHRYSLSVNIIYLTPGRKKNLYCRISDGKERVTFSLEYAVDPQKWDSKKEILDDEDVHYYTLLQLKDRLNKKYHALKTDGKESVLNLLKNEVDSLMAGNGLEGLARSLFDFENKGSGVPPYDDFIKAFEKHSGLTKSEFKVQPLDELAPGHRAQLIHSL
ncbi:MAG TPA: hypothetical protein VGN00_07680 [Puia sp.]|jgi:hypothetical protein